MERANPLALERLALVLAGAGSKCRRLLEDVSSDEPALAVLDSKGAPGKALYLARKLSEEDTAQVLRRLAAAGWRWMIPGDPGYPSLLTDISDPPFGLFIRGEIGQGRLVTIVGSRKATSYGQQVARLLGEELARAGVIVVSGMARGVDSAAHEGALKGQGRTVAVWGTGPDEVYPAEHGGLAEAIAGSGALLTEYPPGTPPRRRHFPERNRILAGMAESVVVVEAAARSGALITARLAIDEGRDVLAVPGNIFSDLSVGPNALLRLGARPLLTPRDLFDQFGAPQGPAQACQDEPETGLLVFLGHGKKVAVDDLAAQAGVEVQEILTELLQLELSGKVERLADGRYSRT